MKFYQVFFENLSRKFKLHFNLTRIMGTFEEDLCIFMIASHSVLLRMRDASDKSSRENQNTHYIFSNILSKNCTTYEIMWKNLVQPLKPQVTIQHGTCTLHAG
jgi:hypothetical protein